MNTKWLLWAIAFPIFAFNLVMQVGCATTARTHMAKYNYLILKLESDRSVARVGEPVHIRFTIINEGGDTSIESQDTPVMDIVVSPMGSNEVLLAWSTQNPDKVVHGLEWKPGESKTLELIWTPRQEDIAFGYYHDVFLGGQLYSDGKSIQGATVQICASNFCR